MATAPILSDHTPLPARVHGFKPACAYADADLHFVDKGGDTEPAHRLCDEGPYPLAPAPCPLRGSCLVAALAERRTIGVWGGTSSRDRAAFTAMVRRGVVASEAAAAMFGELHWFAALVRRAQPAVDSYPLGKPNLQNDKHGMWQQFEAWAADAAPRLAALVDLDYQRQQRIVRMAWGIPTDKAAA